MATYIDNGRVTDTEEHLRQVFNEALRSWVESAFRKGDVREVSADRMLLTLSNWPRSIAQVFGKEIVWFNYVARDKFGLDSVSMDGKIYLNDRC